MTSRREPKTWSPCRIAFAFVVISSIGCSGVAGVREQSSDRALATHCQEHGCGSDERAEHLGEGCYVVHAPNRHSLYGRLYDCTQDILPAGEVMCLDVTPCPGLCKKTITVEGREVPTDRCRQRWDQYQRSQHPLTCSPVGLAVSYEPADLGLKTPRTTLDLPRRLMDEVLRSGKDRLLYTVELCASATGLAAGEPTHSTGFAEIDQLLRARIGELELDLSNAPGSCVNATFVLGKFECEAEQVST